MIQAHEAGWWQGVLAHGPDHPALTSGPEIALALGRRPQSIRKARMRGRLPPPVLVAGRLRWLRRDVAGWMLTLGHDPSRLSKALGPGNRPSRGRSLTGIL